MARSHPQKEFVIPPSQTVDPRSAASPLCYVCDGAVPSVTKSHLEITWHGFLKAGRRVSMATEVTRTAHAPSGLVSKAAALLYKQIMTAFCPLKTSIE